VRSRGEDIDPLVGARRRDQLAEGIGSLGVVLSAQDLARIDAAVQAKGVSGERYSPHLLEQLDSERG
jgi:aryl-alcohol dehydrogenase-like predicted oxidoreductase